MSQYGDEVSDGDNILNSQYFNFIKNAMLLHWTTTQCSAVQFSDDDRNGNFFVAIFVGENAMQY